MNLRSLIRDVPDFPKQGIIFRDIMALLAEPSALDHVINEIVKEWGPQITAVAGLEARGFLFGPLIAYELQVPFVPIRKKGKLPGKVVGQSYALEYGTDTIEIQEGAFEPGAEVLLFDDLLATGGTAHAACQLIERVNANVVGCAFIVELAELGGREKLAGRMIQSLEIYQDEPVS
jgi:adenine phosphoribosyltransferase